VAERPLVLDWSTTWRAEDGERRCRERRSGERRRAARADTDGADRRAVDRRQCRRSFALALRWTAAR